MVVVSITLLLLLLLFSLSLIHGSKSKVVLPLPPGPTIWQLWRKRSTFANNPHVALKELAEIHGPLLSFRVGGQLVVVASSPAIAHEIHKTNNLSFSGRFMPWVYHNVPGTMNASLAMSRDCDASWKFLRGVTQNCMFSSKAIKSAAPIRKTKVMDLMLQIAAMGRAAVAVNVEHVVFATFTNIITTLLISADLFDHNLMGFVDQIIHKATVPGFTDVFPILKGVDFWSGRKSLEIYRDIKLVWGDIITQRRATINNIDGDHLHSNQDFLDVLIGYSFHDDQISMILMELLLAATDSTSITAVWLLAELIKNEEILDKVRKEIAKNAVEGGMLKESLVSECSYFEACIKETLRLHIPGPLAIPHRAIKSCRVNNCMIPKDSIVVVNAWAIHLDPNVWEDPNTFKPERFLGSKIDFKGAHFFEFIPFGAGNRMCPGWNVGVKGVQLVVAALVHHFDWSLPHGQNPSDLDMTDKFGTSLKMEKPFYLIPQIRQECVGFKF
ncbi:hypothetical protein C2S52_008860 [Perilla frutescens var. hirtella]|nr:hypothetical protein C2S52_008860 [Perilla frutescens var. hirtella]